MLGSCASAVSVLAQGGTIRDPCTCAELAKEPSALEAPRRSPEESKLDGEALGPPEDAAVKTLS